MDLKDKYGWSALMHAVHNGRVNSVVQLLGKDAQIDLDFHGTSPLILSSFAGHLRLTKLLLSHGADVNLQSNNGITALMMSSYKGHREIVELLLANYGASTSIVSATGMTALDLTVKPC